MYLYGTKMKHTMKALKIDVVTQTVTNVNLENYTEIYDLIGNGCELFCCPIQFENQDTLFADDESLLRDNLEGCFMLPEWRYPIVGNAIILGTDDEGESIDCKYTKEYFQENLIWGNKEVAESYRETALYSMPEIYVFE